MHLLVELIGCQHANAIQITAMKRTRINLIATLTLVLIAGWFLVRSFGPYSSLRRMVTREIGIGRLQEWAVSVLDQPPERFAAGPKGALRQEDLPDDIRPLTKFGLLVYETGSPDDESDDHVFVACGNGFYHYGLRIGRPGFKPSPDGRFTIESLADGVWGLRE